MGNAEYMGDAGPGLNRCPKAWIKKDVFDLEDSKPVDLVDSSPEREPPPPEEKDPYGLGEDQAPLAPVQKKRTNSPDVERRTHRTADRKSRHADEDTNNKSKQVVKKSCSRSRSRTANRKRRRKDGLTKGKEDERVSKTSRSRSRTRRGGRSRSKHRR